MKMRTGFVSNSSSTSFTLVTSSDAHYEAMGSLTDEQKAVINAITATKKLGGADVVVLAAEFGDVFEPLILGWEGFEHLPSGEVDRYQVEGAIHAYRTSIGDKAVTVSETH